MVDLTKRQREIFDYIGKYTDKMGYPPTVREIGQAVGLTSSSTVHVHLANLEKAGVLRRDPSKPRALEVLVGKANSAGESVRDSARDVVDSVANVASGPSGLPLLGRVSAGPGILAEENIEDYVDVPEMIGGGDGDYVLEVRGESMKNAGITVYTVGFDLGGSTAAINMLRNCASDPSKCILMPFEWMTSGRNWLTVRRRCCR